MQGRVSDVLLPWVTHREDAPQIGFNVRTGRRSDVVADTDAGNLRLIAKVRVGLDHRHELDQRRNMDGTVQEIQVRGNVNRRRARDAFDPVALAHESPQLSQLPGNLGYVSHDRAPR